MNRALASAVAAAVLACSRPSAPVDTPPDAASAPPPADGGDGAVSASPPAAPPAVATAPDAGTAAPAVPDGGAAPPAAATAAPAGSDGGAAPPAAASAAPAPEPAPVTSVVARVGAQEVRLQRDEVTTIDPRAAFELTASAHLADGRLALHDEADAMVASTGTTELGEGTSRYRLVPDEPLRPGSRYVLRLDGAVTREPHGVDGHPYAPVVLQLRTSGERPPATVRKKRGSRR